MDVFTREQVLAHDNYDTGVWVIYNKKVYNVSQFSLDHPGGTDAILQHGGQDVTLIMKDELVHSHSQLAYEILDKYCIGTLSDGNENTDENEKDDFLDLSKPIVWQIWEKPMTKAYYLKEVHKPRYLPEPARFFKSDFLEMLSRTKWYVIPLFWGPIVCLFFYLSVNLVGLFLSIVYLFFGVVHWTLFEYTIHRFLFHMDALLPDHKIFIFAHFLIHGVHHYLPMDKLRLVFPPTMGIPFGIGLWLSLGLAYSTEVQIGIACGVLLGYIAYDLIHYYLHHGIPYSQHLRNMKTYHINHHYLNHELGFGISSKFWDIVFGTLLPDKIK